MLRFVVMTLCALLVGGLAAGLMLNADIAGTKYWMDSALNESPKD